MLYVAGSYQVLVTSRVERQCLTQQSQWRGIIPPRRKQADVTVAVKAANDSSECFQGSFTSRHVHSRHHQLVRGSVKLVDLRDPHLKEIREPFLQPAIFTILPETLLFLPFLPKRLAFDVILPRSHRQLARYQVLPSSPGSSALQMFYDGGRD